MNLMPTPELPLILSGRDVTAVLGPTNTGKTHLAIERMLAHQTGMIGLPLRLLAREVYNRVAERVGLANVALITGEEKIMPPGARYAVCTVEAMPRQTDMDFVAIDEVQLANDLERGHIFTDRILHLRGRQETLLLGAATMRGILEKLLRGISVVTRPRLSNLTYAGSKKITGNARIVDQHGDGAVIGLDPGNTGSALFIVGNIPLVGGNTGLFREFLRRVVIAGVICRDLVPCRFQGHGYGCADTTCSARNDCRFGHISPP